MACMDQNRYNLFFNLIMIHNHPNINNILQIQSLQNFHPNLHEGNCYIAIRYLSLSHINLIG